VLSGTQPNILLLGVSRIGVYTAGVETTAHFSAAADTSESGAQDREGEEGGRGEDERVSAHTCEGPFEAARTSIIMHTHTHTHTNVWSKDYELAHA